MYKFYKLNPLQVGSGTIIPEGFIEYTEEPQELLDALAVEKEAQDLQAKVNEAKQYLNSTDHKFFNGYKSKPDEDLTAIEAKRDEAREFIRTSR